MNSKRVTVLALIGLCLFVTIQLRADDSDEDERAAQRSHAEVLKKLRAIVIESIDVNNITLREALKVLSEESIKADPDHRGVSFIGRFGPEAAPVRVTVSLNHVTLKEAIADMFEYSVVGSDVYVEYRNEIGLDSRTFRLPNGLYLLGPNAPGESQKHSYDVLQQFSEAGVRFAPGATAMYRPDEKKLTVVATPDEINEVDELLNR